MTTATMSPSVAAPTTSTLAPISGGVSGAPRVLLRLEGAVVLAFALAAYAHLGAGWGTFAALFLVPDLAFFGYLGGARIGSIAYNTTHSYLGPAILGALALAMPALLPLAVIWAGHVGFDRMMGYGLKYGGAFGDTHLGRVGKSV